MTYHSSRVCAYCKSEFMGHTCPNCGAPYSPDVRHSPGYARIASAPRYTLYWMDYRKLYRDNSDEEDFTSGEL